MNIKQQTTVNQVKKMLPNAPGVDIALLYGSLARDEANPNSDIDIQLLVNENFVIKNFKTLLQKEFNTDIQSIREVAMRNKVVAYLKSQPKIEFAICTNIAEINRNFLGTEIANIDRSVLYEPAPQLYNIRAYLFQLIQGNKTNTGKQNTKLIYELIDKFLYEFESCSAMHRRSDGYQFNYFYNIALHVATQLNYLSKGHNKFTFLPKQFIANILSKEEQEPFYDLKSTLFLPESNQQKRKLLTFFYAAIEKLVPSKKFNEVKQFCEWIFNRDFLWNFRDVSIHNPTIKSGMIYRTATMTLFQNEHKFNELLNEKQIKTVIDLRADREIEELPYHEYALSKFKYVKAQLDPWNQPDWFKEKHHQGTNEEIAYRYFVLGCQDQIKTAMEAIIKETNGSVAIHCFAGKDRTGIFVSMLHLLVETPIEFIYADYLASEHDVKLSRLKIALDIINDKGGIEPYLISCRLSENQILQLKRKLSA